MSNKSYKREVAGGLIALWSSFAINIFWFTSVAETITAKGNILVGIAPFILIPGIAVFGFHAHINKDKE